MKRRLPAYAIWALALAGQAKLAAVTPLPAGVLVQHKASFFNLEHKQIRFTPSGVSSYQFTVKAAGGLLKQGAPIAKTNAPQLNGQSWRVRLPFPFPFAGKKWDTAYVNTNGNLTFGAPEAASYPEHDTWPDGTMRWLASSIETRSIDGRQLMIAPFWGLNSAQGTRISTKASGSEWIVTWDAVRYQATNEAYTPLGRSIFQVRLRPDGSIEFHYQTIAERDGLVGVFCGRAETGEHLDGLELPPAGAVHPNLHIRRVDVEDLGTGLHFTFALAFPVPERVPTGKLSYRAFALSDDEGYAMNVHVDANGVTSTAQCFLVNPDDNATPHECAVATLATAKGSRIDLYLPKIGLKNPAKFSWKAGASFLQGTDAASEEVVTGDLREVRVTRPMASGVDLTSASRSAGGSLYQVFHYPFIAKSRFSAFKYIYGKVAAEDDLAIVFTDFRIDDLHNHGSSNGTHPEDRTLESPYSRKELFGSSALQQAAGPIYLGPRFSETLRDDARSYKNYAFAIGWMAHEMTHRWAAYVRWNGADQKALLDSLCSCHWSPFLNTPAMIPVSRLFTDSPYPEESIMGGMTVETLPDGTQTGRASPWGTATGLSALDLYLMGMIAPEEIPDTFVITGSTPDGKGGNRGGTETPVRIADIIAANGPRNPAAKDAQHRFKLGIYLLHEDGREPYSDKLAQARGLEAALIRYFSVATGGRMTVTASR